MLAAAVLACTIGPTLASGPTVNAHAGLESSTPADGATVDALPAVVELIFNEVVGQPAQVAVTGPDGTPVTSGEIEVVDRAVRQPLLTTPATPGPYAVSFEVLSADGHAISGTIGFTLTAPAAAAVPAVSAVPANPAASPPVQAVPPSPSAAAASADPLVVGGLAAVLVAAVCGAALAVWNASREGGGGGGGVSPVDTT